ncbi:MAG: beta-N-acetylglucosaminidase domain-containing protein [Bacteroidales bacterium]|nr:beta-N-acetylglucosaminidase domain-containing protein [Bacteroidales bacterium]
MNVKNVLLIIFIAVLITGCKKDDQSRLQASWSAKDPIAIPFNNRNHEKVLGNIAPNPSFETGKIYYQENGIKSFDINGWKQVGNNIEWINSTANGTGINEIYDGIHSVKITREIADETESIGTGILSDFIKVIPGNYSLKLYLKLENVIPNQMRLGTKMYDAINIKLKYYDKSKLEVDKTEFNAFTNVNIDNSFKAYSLSNYWSIKEFGWGEIHGKTANYPYFDGDLPDNVRYVKIFIGLKGTGTMWVDKVDFYFTNENFTLLERLEPYFNSSLSVQDMVYPKPKELVKNSDINYYNTENNVYPIVVIPENSNKLLINAAQSFSKLLNERINNISKDQFTGSIEIVKNNNPELLPQEQFIVNIGSSDLTQESQLPHSYSIVHCDSLHNIVCINAFDKEGYENAALTFKQLLSTQNYVFHSADIIDYPDFLSRNILINSLSFEHSDFKEKIDLLRSYKYSTPYLEIGTKNAVEFLNSENDKYSIKINLSDYSERISLIKSLESNSLASILIYDDRAGFQNDYTEEVENIRKIINGENKKAEIELFPYWSNLEQISTGHGEAEYFFKKLNKSNLKDINIFWNGSSKYSYGIDYADLTRMNEMTEKTLILLDNNLIKDNARFTSNNTAEYYAGKLRLLSFMEPYNPYFSADLYENGNKKILLNTQDISDLDIIRVLTAANYYWNVESYNPEWSLWVVLNKLIGRENAINIIYFNDACFGLIEICKKIEIEGLQFKNQRIAKNFESDLNKYYLMLQEGLNNDNLLKDLEQIKTDILKDYYSILKTAE